MRCAPRDAAASILFAGGGFSVADVGINPTEMICPQSFQLGEMADVLDALSRGWSGLRELCVDFVCIGMPVHTIFLDVGDFIVRSNVHTGNSEVEFGS